MKGCIGVLIPILLQGSWILNEFMVNPEGSENTDEFIELINTSPLSRSPAGLFIGDAGDMDELMVTSERSRVEPGGILLILDPDYEGSFDSLLPDTLVTVTIGDSRFGGYGLSNSSEKWYFLSDSSGFILDSLCIPANLPEGVSYERQDTSSSTWKVSVAVGGTPGRRNSICPGDYDADLRIAGFTPDSSRLQLQIINTGTRPWQPDSVKIAASFPLSAEAQVISLNAEQIGRGDTLRLTRIPLSILSSGWHHFSWYLYIREAAGPFCHTDSVFTHPGGNLKINEYLYLPGEVLTSEYVELLNTGDLPVNLQDFYVGDDSRLARITPRPVYLRPQRFILLCENTNAFPGLPDSLCLTPEFWPSLNNDGDSLRITGPGFITCEKLRYTSGTASEKDVAMERVDTEKSAELAENWAEQRGGSPGLPNINKIPDQRLQISICGLSATETRLHIALAIRNTGRLTTFCSSVRIRCSISPESYNQEPLITRSVTLNDSLFPGDSLSLESDLDAGWTGMNYFLADFPADENNPDCDSLFLLPEPSSLAINEFCPIPGDDITAEYVELFNQGTLPVNLRSCRLADRTRAIPLSQAGLAEPGTFSVLAPAGAQLNSQPGSPIWRLSLWPSQNNSSDLIQLLGPNASIIDELEYDSDWDIRDGFALERINVLLPAKDPQNWAANASGSPGSKNHLTAGLQQLTYFDFRILNTGNEKPFTLTLSARNTGFRPLENLLFSLYGDRNFDGLCQQQEELAVSRLPASLSVGDTLRTTLSFGSPVPGILPLIFRDNLGNIRSDTVITNYDQPRIRINELMPIPEAGGQEWIELVNTGNDTLNLMGWIIHDARDSCALPRISLPAAPGDFILICPREDPLYNFPVPDQCLFIPSAIPGLNNSTDHLVLLTPSGSPVDSLSYGPLPAPEHGISLEFGTDSGWMNSMDPLGATPGRINSREAWNYHLELLHGPSNLCSRGDSIRLFILNNGYRNIENISVKLSFEDRLFLELHLQIFPVGDTLRISHPCGPALPEGPGVIRIFCMSQDITYSDTSLYFRSFDHSPAGINEVLFVFSESNPLPEFIEIASSDSLLDLNGWSVLTSNSSLQLPPGKGRTHRILTASDSAFAAQSTLYPPLGRFPVLKNSGDILRLLDPAGVIMDSADLRNHSEIMPGISLEKNSDASRFAPPSAWGRSLSSTGHSAGRPNSRAVLTASEKNSLSIFPAHLSSRQNTSGALFTIICSSGLQSAELYIFDLRGRLIFNTGTIWSDGGRSQLSWNCRDPHGDFLPVGLYLGLVKVRDTRNRLHIFRNSFTVYE